MPIAQLFINGLRFHAYHGVHAWEQVAGGEFSVDIQAQLSIPSGGYTDDLKETVDYEKVYQLVAHRMNVPVKLIETLAQNIAFDCLNTFALIQTIRVQVTKQAPPIGGPCSSTAVEFTLDRASNK